MGARTLEQPEIVTFKADRALLDRLRGIRNRSEFIRAAVQAALENVCPICRGTGTLTQHQRVQWERFAADHPLEACTDCHGVHPVCAPRRRPRRSRP